MFSLNKKKNDYRLEQLSNDLHLRAEIIYSKLYVHISETK